ncbi:MAG TPA: 4Fe-4S cluster-binding domain-containing protein [Bacteroidales bacterium]|nr:4Fe-4S cluster-binding domain-containing protein [Bacteroidales bacterium]HPS16753.1 4Fe-4S cluster-binding domain-containing protein [Bacteroidales bacterium]
MFDELTDCMLCPRECHADRVNGKPGYCKSDDGSNIGSVCIHMGEEPVICGEKGICNVFFTHCNLQCIYCQNFQISCNSINMVGTGLQFSDAMDKIIKILDKGINLLGFVSPSHCIPQIKYIIEKLRNTGRNPVIVYNSNAYDKVDTLKNIEEYVDVYLPDFKYSDKQLAKELSDVPDYPEKAIAAIKEMVRQKGTSIRLNEHKQVESGVIIRHLVLPGYVDNSVNALKILSEEISPLLHISLMSQYFPTPNVKNNLNLGRKLNPDEYQMVVEALDLYGFHRGWIQDMESSEHYKPDFDNEHPFNE